MKALVTGATGFVGSHLAELLHRRGDEVTALIRNPAKAAHLASLGTRLIEGDLSSRDALAAAVTGQDIIYHVAGTVAARNEAAFLLANRDGVMRLVEAAEQTGRHPRFVLVSSMAAGGPAPRGRPLSGEEPPRPVTQYGRSKLAGEAALRSSRLRWTIVRPPMVYGPRDREVLKVFQIARYGVAPIFGTGAQELSAVYGPDLAAALVAAGSSETAVGRTYYACHPEIVQSAEFVRKVRAAVAASGGKDPDLVLLRVPSWLGRGILTVTGGLASLAGQATVLTADKANEFFQPAWTGDPSPLTRDTGWQARHDLTAGLAETTAWYRNAGWL